MEESRGIFSYFDMTFLMILGLQYINQGAKIMMILAI